MAELFKAKPTLKRKEPNYIKGRSSFLKDRFIAGLNKRYRDLLEISNLDQMKFITFDELKHQAYQMDKRSLDQAYSAFMGQYSAISAMPNERDVLHPRRVEDRRTQSRDRSGNQCNQQQETTPSTERSSVSSFQKPRVYFGGCGTTDYGCSI